MGSYLSICSDRKGPTVATDDDPDPPLGRNLKFQLGYSSVPGVARRFKPLNHPHVLRVSLTRGPWTSLVLRLTSLLPLTIQNMVRATWPAFFLPDVVVVKKLKPSWNDEFQNEQYMYKKLEPLQGRLIPVFYGEAWCEGTRALVLSEVRGLNSIKQGPNRLDWEEYGRRLRAACAELARYGVILGDYNIPNIFIVDDGLMLVDLEKYYEVEPEEVERYSGWSADAIWDRYGGYLNSVDEYGVEFGKD